MITGRERKEKRKQRKRVFFLSLFYTVPPTLYGSSSLALCVPCLSFSGKSLFYEPLAAVLHPPVRK
jgi:hypothetical protein